MSVVSHGSTLSKRSRAAVSEECYASERIRMRLVGDEPPSNVPNTGDRHKTSRGSSDDHDSVQDDGYVDEAFRAGGPYLCTVPVTTINIGPEHPSFDLVASNTERLTDTVFSKLASGGVRGVRNILFCLRQSVYDKEPEPVLTLLIEAEKSASNDPWLQTSRDVQLFLCTEGLPKCSVEIADNRAFILDQIFPLGASDRIRGQWTEVVNSIWTHCDLDDVNSIGCFRIGKYDDWRENPPTVLITVNPDTELEWKPMREDVILILENHSLPEVAVKIQRDRIIRDVGTSNFPGMHPDALSGPALVGQSVGRRNHDDRQGTFGGFVEIQHPHSREWITYGLTCNHCVLPEDEQVDSETEQLIPYWQKHGVAPNDPLSECYLQIDHPNSKDLKLAIETRELQKTWAADEQYVCIREAIEEDKTYLIPSDRAKYDKKKSIIEQCDNEISTIKRFDQSGNQALGFVFASSGDKTQVVQTTPYKESVVDWALIHIKGGRMGQNTIITDGDDTIALTNWDGDSFFPNQVLFKSGRVTCYTGGYYSGVQTCHVKHDLVNGEMIPKKTWEHTITNPQKPFSRRGDSGSLVFDIVGNVVGMIWASNEQCHLSYFTHILDVFKNIRETTHADVRIKE